MDRSSRRARARAVRLAVTGVLAGILVALVPPAASVGLSPAACRVANARTGTVKTTFTAAVDAANAGDTLTVRGTCQAGIELGKDLTIRGTKPKGAGTPTLRGVIGFLADSRSVLVIPDTVNVTLASITLTGGGGTAGFPPDVYGGGLIVRGRATLMSVKVVGNDLSAGNGYGGGIEIDRGDVVIGGRSVIGQNSARWGAGIAVDQGGTLEIRDKAVVSGNIATEDGGGIYAVSAAVTISGSAKIKQNVAAGSGGGIYAEDSQLRVRDRASVTANAADDPGAAGGGIKVAAGTWAVIRDSAIVSGNSAGVGDGGGIAVVGRVSVIGTAEVRENTSAGRGGGVWLKGPSGELDLLSSALIVQNQGFGGGGGLGYESSTTPSLGPCGIAIAGNSPNNCESF